jgi:hypothetical protein
MAAGSASTATASAGAPATGGTGAAAPSDGTVAGDEDVASGVLGGSSPGKGRGFWFGIGFIMA